MVKREGRPRGKPRTRQNNQLSALGYLGSREEETQRKRLTNHLAEDVIRNDRSPFADLRKLFLGLEQRKHLTGGSGVARGVLANGSTRAVGMLKPTRLSHPPKSTGGYVLRVRYSRCGR
jgi:hypothetical protein